MIEEHEDNRFNPTCPAMKTKMSSLTTASLAVAAVVTLFSACSSTPATPQKNDGITYRRTDKLDRVWLAEGFDFAGYDAALVPATRVDGVKPKDDLETERLESMQSALGRELANALEGRRIFAAVLTKEADIKEGSKVLRIDNTIIDFTRGSSTARYMVGFGAGMPRVRVRGTITAQGDAKPLCVFEIQRAGDWFGSGFTSSKTLQTQAAIELADDAAAFIARVAKHEKINYR